MKRDMQYRTSIVDCGNYVQRFNLYMAPDQNGVKFNS